MRAIHLIHALLAIYPIEATRQASYLTASAVVSDEDGNARIQCWQFDSPFSTYPTVGESLVLANVSNVTVVILPPRSKEGLHKPPHPMLFVLLSGVAQVTLPDGSDEVWIVEGVNGLIVAVDTTGIGHYTTYPGDKETMALQIPFAYGKIPDHEVLKNGACHATSQTLKDKNGLEYFLEEL